MDKQRVLFVLKFREGYDGKSVYSYGHYFSSGLYWSAKFVVDMLCQSGVEAKLVQVVDNNQIDKEVHDFKPTIVVIEALWVVPEKFDILKQLHPHVKWVVRLHSNIPFLANEGVAVRWVKEYAARGVKIAVNQKRAYEDFETILGGNKDLLYLPNYYPVRKKTVRTEDSDILHVGCYGAVRPLKNQLIQAVAAIRYADSQNLVCHFHINGTRVEQGGEAILDNLRALFDGTVHSLIEDRWMNHEEFLCKLRRMDLGMQVSLSETFSIVAADMTSVGLPIVVSPEIEWAGWLSTVNASNVDKITEGIKDALRFKDIIVFVNRGNLKRYAKKSKEIWLDVLKYLDRHENRR